MAATFSNPWCMISISTLLLLTSTCIQLFTIPVWFCGASIIPTANQVTTTSSIMSSMTAATSTTIYPFTSLSYILMTTISHKLFPLFLHKCTSWVQDIYTIDHCTVTASVSTVSTRTTATASKPTMTSKVSTTTATSTVCLHNHTWLKHCAFYTYDSPTELRHANETLAPRNSYMYP
jgi:hypothetical protein